MWQIIIACCNRFKVALLHLRVHKYCWVQGTVSRLFREALLPSADLHAARRPTTTMPARVDQLPSV